jgi:hypothetical protein
MRPRALTCGLLVSLSSLLAFRKNDLPELQQKLRRLVIGKKDRLFLFRLCKSCMEISTVPLAMQERIVQPLKFELVG